MDRVTAYDDDIYAWSQEQAAALRRLAETRRDLPNDLDLEHVAEEIEDLGRSELRTVESFIELLLRHLLKLASAPESLAAEHWRSEVDVQAETLRIEFKNSMRQLVGLERMWRAAKARAGGALADHGGRLLPGLASTCPLALDDLLTEPFDIDRAIRDIVAAAIAPPG